MTDFAAAGTTQGRNLTDRKWREVVMHHEALLRFAFKPVQPLHVLCGAERSGDERLSLTACEYGRAVCSGQHTRFYPDWSYCVELPSVRTFALAQNLVAKDLLFQSVKNALHHLQLFGIFLRFGKELNGFFFRSIDKTVALEFLMLVCVEGVFQIRAD